MFLFLIPLVVGKWSLRKRGEDAVRVRLAPEDQMRASFVRCGNGFLRIESLCMSSNGSRKECSAENTSHEMRMSYLTSRKYFFRRKTLKQSLVATVIVVPPTLEALPEIDTTGTKIKHIRFAAVALGSATQ